MSDHPFSFSPKNRIFDVKIIKLLKPGQNFGIFVSAKEGMDTFLFEMSINDCLHLRTSEMSIDMGRRIVQCFVSNMSRQIMFDTVLK